MSVVQIVPEVNAILVGPSSRSQIRVNVQEFLRSEDPIPSGVHDEVSVLCRVSELGKVRPQTHHTTTRHNRLIRGEQWRRKARHGEQIEDVICVNCSLVVTRNQQQVSNQVQTANETEPVVVDGLRLTLRVHPCGGVDSPVEHGIRQVLGSKVRSSYNQ